MSKEKSMKILSFGSLNLDKVYSVDHFVRAGETLSSSSCATSGATWIL